MARQCRQMNPGTGRCDYWSEDVAEVGGEQDMLPEGCDPDDGNCNPHDDDSEDCDSFFGDGEEDDEVCDECGCELGFCAADCATREDGYDG